MKKIKNYYIYIFISTITRNIIDIYSIVYLYELGFAIKKIIYIYTIVYFLGIFLSRLSLIVGNIIGYKYILMLSSIITGFTFYIIKYSYNLYLIAIFLSLSIFTYHPIKHYYGLLFLKQKKEIGNALILIYMASLLASLVVIGDIKPIYVIIASVGGIIPSLFIMKEEKKKIVYDKKIPKSKVSYFVFDQFRIIFILLEPLYLYLVSSNLYYVGIFNIVLTISFMVYIYLLTNKIDITRKYKIINILFTIVLALKINVLNRWLLLIIAFLEGIGIKTNELVSTMNLYQYEGNDIGYLILVEEIFCLVRVILLTIIYLVPISLKLILYLLIMGIFMLSFHYKKDTT